MGAQNLGPKFAAIMEIFPSECQQAADKKGITDRQVPQICVTKMDKRT